MPGLKVNVSQPEPNLECGQDLVTRFRQRIEGLVVQDGFQCTVCRTYFALQKSTVEKHGRIAHPNEPRSTSKCLVQKIGQIYFGIIQETEETESAHSGDVLKDINELVRSAGAGGPSNDDTGSSISGPNSILYFNLVFSIEERLQLSAQCPELNESHSRYLDAGIKVIEEIQTCIPNARPYLKNRLMDQSKRRTFTRLQELESVKKYELSNSP